MSYFLVSPCAMHKMPTMRKYWIYTRNKKNKNKKLGPLNSSHSKSDRINCVFYILIRDLKVLNALQENNWSNNWMPKQKWCLIHHGIYCTSNSVNRPQIWTITKTHTHTQTLIDDFVFPYRFFFNFFFWLNIELLSSIHSYTLISIFELFAAI